MKRLAAIMIGLASVAAGPLAQQNTLTSGVGGFAYTGNLDIVSSGFELARISGDGKVWCRPKPPTADEIKALAQYRGIYLALCGKRRR